MQNIWTLNDVLTRLINLHALNVLNGSIQVVPIQTTSDARESWRSPLEHPQVSYVRPNRIADLWQSVAAVLVDVTLADILQRNNSIASTKIPTVWIGDCKTAAEFTITPLDEVATWVGKLLCDERMRTAMAPEILFPIPLLRWLPCNGDKINVLHLLSSGHQTDKIDTVLKIAAGSKSVASHSVISLEEYDAHKHDVLSAAGIQIVEASLDTSKDWLQIFRRLFPDVLHLHDMSSVPRWLPIHRHLAEWNIVESEYDLQTSPGYFGAVDVVVCKTTERKALHSANASRWGDAAPKYETECDPINHAGSISHAQSSAHASTDYYSDLYRRVLRMGQE